MVEVIFLNPPYLPRFSRPQRSPAVTKSGTLYYPMWLAYAAAWVEKHGFQFDFIDASAAGISMDEIERLVKETQPRLIVIDTATPSIYNDINVGDKLKIACPQTFILLVGTHVSALPHQSLELSTGVDGVAVGEYENTVLSILNNLKNGIPKDEFKVPGLILKNHPRNFQIDPPEKIKCLDDVPFVSQVYKRFLDINHYFNPNALYPMVALVTGRGCRYRCSFCVYPQVFSGKGQRTRSTRNILEEFRFIKKEMPRVKAVFLEDDTFTADINRCREFCKSLVHEGIKISWTTNARADVDLDTLRLMRKAGCKTLCVGFESGNQRILDVIGKKITTDTMVKFAHDARKAGLLVHGCFIYGAPGETWETMKQTLKFALSLKIDTAQFYPMMIYPGTKAYDWFNDNNFIVSENFSRWLTPEGLHNCVIRTENLESKDLVWFCDYSRRKFYLRMSYMLKKGFQVLRDPVEFRRKWKSAFSLLPHLFRVHSNPP